MRYSVLHFEMGSDNRFHLQVAVEGFPQWVVEAVVMQTASGAAVSDLLIYPRHDTGKVASDGRPLPDEPVFGLSWAEQSDRFSAEGPWGRPMRATPWSADANDVPPGGIPGRLMRAINPGQLLFLAGKCAAELAPSMSAAAEHFADSDPGLSSFYRTVVDRGQALASPAKRTGRRGNGIDHYLLWAVRYHEKTAAGVAHPIKELADEHDETTTNYVRDTITDARRRYGLLTTSGQGRAGGQLTPLALDLIAERTRAKEAE